MEKSILSRRRFLAGAGAVGVAAALGVALEDWTTREEAPSPAAGASSGSTLVLCTLYGGNDGLNTVIPYQDPNYLQLRGPLAYQPNEVIPLRDGLALNPQLKGMKGLWDRRELAIVRGVGYPNPSFSHFRAMDIWQSAVPDTDSSTGWIGRWLDRVGRDPLKALSMGPTLPLAFNGAKFRAAALPSEVLDLPGTPSDQAVYASLERFDPGDPSLEAAVARSGSDLLRLQRTLGEYLASSSEGTPANRTSSGRSGSGATRGAAGSPVTLQSQLDIVSRLIKAGAPPTVYGVSLTGFDTHANEKATQAQLLATLDTAVSSFITGLRNDQRGASTVTLIYTEFGRRIAANASGGTDHGAAGPVFVVGPSVRGGFYGEEPTLVNVDNLRYSTDFRSVYATVLDEVLGIDHKDVLGTRFKTLNFV